MAYDGLERSELASALNARLRDADPEAIIEAAVDALGDKVALVSSFGAESAVLLHMAAGIKKICRSSSWTPACCSVRRWITANSSPASSA